MKEQLIITRSSETFVTLQRGTNNNSPLNTQNLIIPAGLQNETIESIIIALGFATRAVDGKLFTDSHMTWISEGLDKTLEMMYGSRFSSPYPNGDLLSRRISGRKNTRQWFRDELGEYDAIDDIMFAKLPDWKIAALITKLSILVTRQFEEEFDFRDDRFEVRIDKIREELFLGFLSTHQELIEANDAVKDDLDSLGWGARSDRATGPD